MKNLLILLLLLSSALFLFAQKEQGDTIRVKKKVMKNSIPASSNNLTALGIVITEADIIRRDSLCFGKNCQLSSFKVTCLPQRGDPIEMQLSFWDATRLGPMFRMLSTPFTVYFEHISVTEIVSQRTHRMPSVKYVVP